MDNNRMQTRTPEELVQAWFERVWNQGDESAIDDILSPTGVVHGLPGGPINGPSGFKPFAQSFRSAFPDIRIVARRCVTEGNMCAAHCDVEGTHTGHGIGIAPTGRKMNFSGMSFVRSENGQIQEAWNTFDFLTLYQQLDLIPQAFGQQ